MVYPFEDMQLSPRVKNRHLKSMQDWTTFMGGFTPMRVSPGRLCSYFTPDQVHNQFGGNYIYNNGRKLFHECKWE